MAGSWTTFSAPDTSTGTFNADVMILLTDGSVLVHNGFVSDVANASQWLRLTPDENGKYETGSWSSELDMSAGRQWFGSGVLSDGRVFVMGGEHSTESDDTTTGEIFDPQSNSWSSINKPSAFDYICGDCNGSVLADGRVLLGAPNSSSFPSSKRTAIWDPNDDSWVEAGLAFGALGSTTKTDPFEEETMCLLSDGSVLAPSVVNTPGAQRYVPSLDKWVDAASSPVNLAITTLKGVTVEETGSIIVLPDGTALAIGGTGNTAIYTPPAASDPTGSGSWTQGPTFPADSTMGANWATLTALDAPAALLPSGKVVILAGNASPDDGDFFSLKPVCLEFDPSSTATTLPNLDAQPSISSSNFTWQSCFLVLPTGQLLCTAQSKTLFLYAPDAATSAPDPSWKPANITVPSVMVTGHSYTLSGTQINGLSQACSYGDDAGMATNYPIVRLTNSAGKVTYLRSYNFSTMGIATGASVESCAIDIPSGLAPGNWDLEVVANGIASDKKLVQIAAQDCFFVLENSTFSIGEIDTWVKAMPPQNAVFNPAFYVVVEGFTPAEMGFSSAADLANPPFIPQVPSPFPSDMQINFAGPVVAQDPSLPPTPQRFTFPFSITFTDDSPFGSSAQTVGLNAIFTAGGNTVFNTAAIVLTPNPNPFILHGNLSGNPPESWYLSQDIRVFQVVASPGNNTFGVPLGTSGTAAQIATGYIQAAVTNLRNNVGTTRADFDNMAQDEDSEVLQLLPNDPNTGHAVYNFAVARVRLRDTQNAQNVRVFFRTWQAQQTNAAFSSSAFARATNGEGQPVPVLGLTGDEILTIPFFATERVATSAQLHTQTDDFNRHDIDASAGETDFFFGCWLDINQPSDLRYPQRMVNVSADGPFNGVSPLFPIQQFMMAAHQCLLVEIAYDPDPIPPNADPSNSDKLAQRNLTFVGAPNPGMPASRRVPQTFEIKPTNPKLPAGVMPDELMIEWSGVPGGSHAEIYLPAVSADAVLATASTLYTSHRLERADAHTLRFPAAGITYIPIPPGNTATFPGLITLDLPAGIHKGETFTAIVRQITSVVIGSTTQQNQGTTMLDRSSARRNYQWRRTTGSFKLTIPVSTRALLLEPEEEHLAVMKWVAEAVPTTGRWYKVMQRYLAQLAGRVTFMGGDPGSIQPSGTGLGTGKTHPHPGHPELEFVGKIETLMYDRFGDFEAFTLETSCGDYHRFESREPGIAELAHRAWQERRRIRVLAAKAHPQRPTSIHWLM